MQSLRNKHFKINTNDKQELTERGFSFSRRFDETNIGRMVFVCYSWKHKPILWCGISINTENKDVDINVVDEYGMAYAPWYNDKYSTGNVVVTVSNHNIMKKLKTLGIKEVHRNDGKHRRMRKEM